MRPIEGMYKVPMHKFIDPNMFIAELIYTLLIILFCVLVYYKTKNMYELTKHKGIQFFRFAFLFFGLAYASRILLGVTVFGIDTFFEPHMMKREVMQISILLTGFFSTMAILYLAFSTTWKNINTEQFITYATIMSLLVASIGFVVRSPLFLSIVQLGLILFTGAMIVKNHKGKKKKSSTKALYLSIYAFWFFSILALHSRHLIPFEAKLVIQAISIGIFITVYLKVKKWVR